MIPMMSGLREADSSQRFNSEAIMLRFWNQSKRDLVCESFRQMVVPMVLVTVIGAVWAAARSQELQAQANRGSWPALPMPRFKELNALRAQQAADDDSLKKVLLKNDQVVGVR
jgi:hypothetical protein